MGGRVGLLDRRDGVVGSKVGRDVTGWDGRADGSGGQTGREGGRVCRRLS